MIFEFLKLTLLNGLTKQFTLLIGIRFGVIKFVIKLKFAGWLLCFYS